MLKDIPVFEQLNIRKVSLATKEVQLISAALGVKMINIPEKVDNPDEKDIDTLFKNLGKRGLVSRWVFGKKIDEVGGIADPINNRVYTNKWSIPFESNFAGIDWDEMLGNVSIDVVHEVSHLWFFENCRVTNDFMNINLKFSKIPPVKLTQEEAEFIVSMKIVSEGMATYMEKRCVDYVKDTMVEAVEAVFPGDTTKREDCYKIYSQRYPKSSMNPDSIEEDFELANEAVKYCTNGLISKLKNANVINDFSGDVAYRLGYNLVNTAIQQKIAAGLTESEALTEFANNIPINIIQIKEVLRL